ncbi:MAG: hypothetical protein ABJX32_04605 [Tateyamaria sp.]|uniref:hypothetical protein n=1 Tax=Tateyamaria sp. TaxID=1929288 RepID=UPI00329C5E93
MENGVSTNRTHDLSPELFGLGGTKGMSSAKWYSAVDKHHHDRATYAAAYLELM